MVADDKAGEDDVVDGVGDVADGDHDVGVDEAGQGGLDEEDCQTTDTDRVDHLKNVQP